MSAIELLIGVADDRHDEPFVGADGDADMIVILVDEVGAVDLGIDVRDLLQRLPQALTKKPMKPSLTPCFFSKMSL